MKGGQREAVDRGAADAARRAAGEQGDPPADGSAQGDDPEGVVVVDAARLFTAVAGPPQEALKPPIARVAGAVTRPGSHRTVRTLVVYGSSGRRVVNPTAGRFATSNHPHSASCGGSGAMMCWDAWPWRSTRATSPRALKNARFRRWSTACVWLSAHQDFRPE